MDNRTPWLLSYLAAYKKPLAFALALGLLNVIFATALMFCSGYLITRTAEAGVFLLMVMTPIACVQLFGIGKPLAHYFERLNSHDWVFRVTSDLRRRLYAAIEKRSDAFGSSEGVGEITGILARDIGHLQNLYLRVVFPSAIACLFYLILAIVLGFFSPGYMLAMLVLLACAGLALPAMTLFTLRARAQADSQVTAALYADLADNIMGATDWVLAGRGEEIARLMSAADARLRSLKASMRATQRVLGFAAIAILGVGSWLTIFWAGNTFGATEGSSALVTAFILGFFPIIEVFAPLVSVAALIDPQTEAVERLGHLINDEMPSSQSDNAAEPAGDAPESVPAPPDLTGASPAFELIDASFAYPGADSPALAPTTLRIDAGEHVIVIGKSGAGKSTLTALMRGELAPKSGSVDIYGNPSRAYGDMLPGIVAYVEQTPYVFNRSLRDNLLLANPQANDDELVHALDQVGLTGMLDALPDGLDTLVDEAGMRFSGGERHRIALARALLSHASAVILDEPTVGLDPQTEDALFATLFDALADKTLVVISHHLAHVRDFYRVLVVDDGRITLDGAPNELERSNTWFAQLLSLDR